KNLNTMTLDDFNQAHSEESRKYRAGEIFFLDYWSKVAEFYNYRILEIARDRLEIVVVINELNAKYAFWQKVLLIYGILLFPVNTFLTILLGKKFERLLEPVNT
ncbi:MAG: hypothetical protein WA021_02775, partial [Minisyncoccia bacterium]